MLQSATTNQIPEWVLRQDHHEEVEAIMNETGSSFRKWNGKATFPALNEAGHTSLDFDQCSCKHIQSTKR